MKKKQMDLFGYCRSGKKAPVIAALAMSVLLASPATAMAATNVAMPISDTAQATAPNTVVDLKAIFNAKYYADKNPDLKAKYGYNADMLYWHCLNYGIYEGRTISPILDLKAYRNANPDLQKLYGNDWKAYLNHFLTKGFKEIVEGKRVKTGVLFDPVKYKNAYSDVRDLCGDDIWAITKHYIDRGLDEGRTVGVTTPTPPSADIPWNWLTPTWPSTPNTPTVPNPGTNPDDSDKPGVDPDKPGVDPDKPGVDPDKPGTPEAPATQPNPVQDAIVAPAEGTFADADKPSVAVDEDSKAGTVTVDGTKADAIKTAIGDAATANADKTVISFVIDAVADTSDTTNNPGGIAAESMEVALPAAVITALKEKDADLTDKNIAVTVKSDVGTVVVPLEAIKEAQGEAGTNDVKIAINKVDKANLDDLKTDGVLKDKAGNEIDLDNSVIVGVELKAGTGSTFETVPVTSDKLAEKSKVQITVAAPKDKDGNTSKKVSVYYIVYNEPPAQAAETVDNENNPSGNPSDNSSDTPADKDTTTTEPTKPAAPTKGLEYITDVEIAEGEENVSFEVDRLADFLVTDSKDQKLPAPPKEDVDKPATGDGSGESADKPAAGDGSGENAGNSGENTGTSGNGQESSGGTSSDKAPTENTNAGQEPAPTADLSFLSEPVK